MQVGVSLQELKFYDCINMALTVDLPGRPLSRLYCQKIKVLIFTASPLCQITIWYFLHRYNGTTSV